MGCGSCGSGGCSSNGCGQNGGCATGGCNKLNTYDWLGNMLTPDKSEVDNVYEVRFKNTRKAFYRNVNGLRLFIGDDIVVESDRGYDVGTLSLGGVLAELQMKKKRHKLAAKDLPRIYRKANEADLELLQTVREREQPTMVRGREIIEELNLDMKLSDVEFQADNAKAIFYYIADHRVDFRELIKILAREFRIRVEMKQIGLRHEAGLVGGIGSCGRELCCSTWLTDFKTVSTSAARYQNLSLNPMKISGLCGRLKCCLNFELDAYLDALQDFPDINTIETKKGTAILQKTDIFKGMMWFSYPRETTWHPISVKEVKRIMALNEKGEKPEALVIVSQQLDGELDFVDVVGTELPEIERRRKKGSGRGRGGKKGNQSRGRGRGQGKDSQNRGNRNRPRQEAKPGTRRTPQNKGRTNPEKPGEDASAKTPGSNPREGNNRNRNKGRGPRGGQGRNRGGSNRGRNPQNQSRGRGSGQRRNPNSDTGSNSDQNKGNSGNDSGPKSNDPS